MLMHQMLQAQWRSSLDTSVPMEVNHNVPLRRPVNLFATPQLPYPQLQLHLSSQADKVKAAPPSWAACSGG